MSRIAEIIVDVPVMQTNIPYSYFIPEKFENELVAGMRVIVPFGKGDRQVQGFVTAIKNEKEFNGELKEISDVMDLKPVLNEELIELGEAMAEQTYSFRINCYQTMLPAVYRAKYQKIIKVTDDLPDDIQFGIFKGKNYMDWEEAVELGITNQMLKLRSENKVEVEYLVTDKAKKKTEKYIIPSLTSEEYETELEKVQKNASRQIEFLHILKENVGTELAWKTLKDEYNISSAVLNRAESEGWCDIKEVEVYRDPFEEVNFKKTTALTLTSEQENAYDHINDSIVNEKHEVFLLKGITGSGKTEIYLQTIAQVLEKGQGALMLVPEISLTPQMVHRFKSRFGEDVAVLHSGLSNNEKYDEWRKIERGEAHVVVGARSSIFAPIENLGIIIIDEEHETSYKQEETPRYHARDVAVWRAKYHACPVVLGSATPSLESRARALKNVYTLLELKERANQKALPEVNVVDMREEMSKGNRSTFSTELQENIKDRIQKGEQSVLLLNRRGYSSFIMCRDCGFVLECPNCDISQTLHMDTKTMKCHYCGHEENIPRVCPNCESPSIRYYGTGTQKVEQELNKIIPESKIIRMDVDTTRRKGAHEKLLSKFENKKANILLGTQMIAKGLDFPNVTLVGVLNADTSLSLPDFRSAERTFQLLTQVSGRAGRGEVDGDVIVQSFNPNHYAIQFAKHHDYDSFFKKEMNLRHLSDYSPYYFLTRIMVSHESEITAAKKMGEIVDFIKPSLSDKAITLGPTPRSIARTHNRYHFQTIIKYKNEQTLNKRLHELLSATQKEQTKGLFISIDPKPMNFI